MQVSANDRKLIELRITPILDGMRKRGATDKELQAFTVKYIRNWQKGMKSNGLQPLGEVVFDALRKLSQ